MCTSFFFFFLLSLLRLRLVYKAYIWTSKKNKTMHREFQLHTTTNWTRMLRIMTPRTIEICDIGFYVCLTEFRLMFISFFLNFALYLVFLWTHPGNTQIWPVYDEFFRISLSISRTHTHIFHAIQTYIYIYTTTATDTPYTYTRVYNKHMHTFTYVPWNKRKNSWTLWYAP